MSRKKHSKVKVRGKAARPKSAIGDFIDRLKLLENRARVMKTMSVVVGWADEDREQQRTMPKAKALAINAANARMGRKTREAVSNFDADFIGPGRKAASLATIAKVMRYGRAGGVSAKTGKPYGEIPARNFVAVMHEKFMKPVDKELRKTVVNTIVRDSVPETLQAAAARVGTMCVGALQRAMKDSNSYKPNAPFTINGGWMANPVNGKPFYAKGKGSSRPLWNNGTLIKSVIFEIRNGNNGTGKGGHGR